MGISPKREQLIHRARELYAGGMNFRDVAEALGVYRDTVRRWYRYDLKRGVSWDRERQQEENTHPEHIMKLLERRFGRMVLAGEKASEEGQDPADDYEARLLKMIQIINGYRKSAEEITNLLLALEQFTIFCVEHLARQELAVVRNAVEQFTEKLERENP